ncbi:MAG: CRISPR-associated endonuclease Cas2 [bacterium]|nr:CRISPR-associated endonuclease Cas2 [bacterium]
MKTNTGAKGRDTPRFRTDSRHYQILQEITAGDLFVGFLSSAMSTRLMYKNARERARERYANKLALERLEKCGYARSKKRGSETTYFVTNEGKLALRGIYTHTTSAIRSPEKWDGMWRVIAYDFPEGERSARNSLRYVLSKAGFLQVQKSVWVFPYDSSLFIQLLKKDNLVRAHTIFMKAKSISLEMRCKKHFHIQ